MGSKRSGRGASLAWTWSGLLVCFPALAATPVIQAMHDHDWPLAAKLAAQDADPVAGKIVTFARLLTPGAASAGEINRFIASNPTWPNQSGLRRRLGDAIASNPDQARTLEDCHGFRPTLDIALLRCADAERAAGNGAQARDEASRAWIDGLRDPKAEAQFRQSWPDVATPDVEWRRFDALDWANDPAAARQVARLDPARRALAVARQAFQHRDPRALDSLPTIPATLRGNPALLLEQARWLRLTDAAEAALALWRGAGVAAEQAVAPAHRAAFWAERDRLARALLARALLPAGGAGDTDGAFFLANDEATGAEQKPDALFLTGWIALRRRHDPTQARALFDTLTGLSHSLITQARAWYWLARAQDGEAAQLAYRHAAAFPTTYYGQKAIVALHGQQAVAPAIRSAVDPAILPPQAVAFAAGELVHAAATLARWNDAGWGRSFLLAQAQFAHEPAEFALTARTALALGMPDVAVQTARLGGRQGVALPHAGYPAPFDPPRDADGPLILGLMRQESSFDAGVVSGAGAVGLMQMMPATARQMGRGSGGAALRDPEVNMRLGVAYFDQLLQSFGGVQAYAIAAYNAGPHRARVWVDANGDAGAAGDPAVMIDWIEQIPFAETRNYVQRVLENAQVYAARAAP